MEVLVSISHGDVSVWDHQLPAAVVPLLLPTRLLLLLLAAGPLPDVLLQLLQRCALALALLVPL
jgi:hypothetical protein